LNVEKRKASGMKFDHHPEASPEDERPSMKKCNTRQLEDVPRCAERLGTSERHIRHLVARRKIPFLRVGRLIRFDPEKVDAWLESNTVDVGGAA